MANTSSFGFTNTEALTAKATMTDMKMRSLYAKVEDEPTSAVLSNKTCPLDQGELVTYRAQPVDHVSSSQKIQFPAQQRNGVQYVIKCEEILRTKDADGKVIMDEPVVAYLTIRHQTTSNITDDLITQVVGRVLGAAYDKTAGCYRWGDLMRSALVPVED